MSEDEIEDNRWLARVAFPTPGLAGSRENGYP